MVDVDHQTRGLFCTGGRINKCDIFILHIATTGNAADFGDNINSGTNTKFRGSSMQFVRLFQGGADRHLMQVIQIHNFNTRNCI